MLSEIDLRRDDWLTLEIAVKLVHLRTALGTSRPESGLARSPAAAERVV